MLLCQQTEAVLDARVGIERDSLPVARPVAAAYTLRGAITLSVIEDLSSIGEEWKEFEATADCTAFQSFAWHAAWQKHVGNLTGVAPAVVVGRKCDRILFILPLAVEHGRLTNRLVWHASDLCDYNSPLLAPDISQHMSSAEFVALWGEIGNLLRAHPRLRYDVVVLEKMAEIVGKQANPFLNLPVARNASGAYLMNIAGEWEQFYKDKRSSATRRHDRSKRKRLAESGTVSFVTAAEPCQIETTLDVLFAQKAASFAKRGVPNFLARPGYRDFFRDVAANPLTRCFVHVSKLEVGTITAAANFGLLMRGRYYHVIASYDAGEISRFGPGTAHLHELIGYALQRGCIEFDFTVGDEPYKRDWCDRELKLYDLRSAATPRGWAVASASGAGNRLKRLIKQTPTLWRAFTQGRLMMAWLKGATTGDNAGPKPGDAGGDA